jgi:hypothetical protein
VFGFIWRGEDGEVRAGVGTAGTTAADAHIAEVLYRPIKDFTEQEHFELLQLFDGNANPLRGSGYTLDENRSMRHVMKSAGLDKP